jgi:alpha-L-fucosidase
LHPITYDFGYATLGQGKVYLFVKDVPVDGVLRLPGLRAGRLNDAYLLGGPSHESFPVTSTKDAASVRIGKDSLAAAGYLPVIVLPFSGKLEVAQPATRSRRRGKRLPHAIGCRPFFYNGAGYEAPETLYKLRWFIVAPPGRYRAEIEVKPTHAKARLDLVVEGSRIPLTVPTSAAATVTIKQNIRIVPARFQQESPFSIELTPPEPFVKGTQLSCGILTVRLVRESDP